MKAPERTTRALWRVRPASGVRRGRMGAVVLLLLALAVSVRCAEPATVEPVKEPLLLPDRSKLTVFLAIPENVADKGARLCLVLGGGDANEGAAKSAMTSLGLRFVERGWAVASPISPDGKPLFGENGQKIPALIAVLQKRPQVAKGKVLLAGVSNGGIAALEIAADVPALVQGVIAVPGVLSPTTEISRLRGMPIYLRIGAKDYLHWGLAFPRMVAELHRAGAFLDAKLIENEGHGVTVDWVDLDRWLARATAPRPVRRPRTR